MNGDISIYPGEPFPLGATYTSEGTNFAIFSENATAVYLCLYDRAGKDGKERRIKLPERTHQVWHTFIPEVKPGQIYAYRVEGPYDPTKGHRFNANKALLDPYSKAVTDTLEWNDALFGYEIGSKDEDLSISKEDSAPYMYLSVVVDTSFDWEDDRSPYIPLHETIIYEAHVRGLTMKNQEIPQNIRGTYKALAHPSIVKHLKDLRITSLELLPVHHFLKDRHLVEKHLTNYWGYNSIGFFAPEPSYAEPGPPVDVVKEFKQMVKELHREGIEVILDVVYNHTAEGNQMGPTLSFKGIDNWSYYRLDDSCRYYKDYTGTGNTLNATLPNVLQLMMDSLRYWIQEMHVDGFRFDLAATLARGLHEVDKLSSFFEIIQQDPVISRVKLIAEPWDIGEGGYMVGKFPAGWMEWNGKYRDCIRDYWRGKDATLGDFALRFTGSPDLYEDNYRRPGASVNFITAHDGFTLHDLVSYNDKHNEANGEDNKDGDSNNRSWNCGTEGETTDEGILKLRAKQERNFLVTLFLSQGVPMLTAGDELGKTQKGNNNAYCQDNEISWIDWEHADKDLLKFVQTLIAFRKKHPVFCRKKWFQGKPVKKRGLTDVKWFQPNGVEMDNGMWQADWAKSLAVYLNGLSIEYRGGHGEEITDDFFYIMFNAHHDAVEFQLLPGAKNTVWVTDINTAGESFRENVCYKCNDKVKVEGRSVVVLRSASSPDV